MEKISLIINLAIVTLLSISLVSAYSWGYNYYRLSPADLLNNEWFVFALIFIFFFGIIFFALGKTFKNNLSIPAIVAGVLAFFIAALVSRRVTFYGYIGEEFTGWIILVALALVILLSLKAILELTGPIGLAAGVIGTWLLIRFIDWSVIFPYTITESLLMYILQSIWGALIAGTIAFIIIASRKKIRKLIRKKTPWERMWSEE